jgi:transcriptional regulator
MTDAPSDYIAHELTQIVGIEIELTRLEGKRKLSQNREPRDFESTVRELEQRGQTELASAMTRFRTSS